MAFTNALVAQSGMTIVDSCASSTYGDVGLGELSGIRLPLIVAASHPATIFFHSWQLGA